MFVLSGNDIRRLSPNCRNELMALMMSSEAEDLDSDELMTVESLSDEPTREGATPTADDVLEEKSVVDLSVDEAHDLLANIRDKSKETLKRFASGKPVALGSLIGSEGEYRDYSELKRSFVGAVNRRLRTVSGVRNAVLFSSDRDKTRIKTTPKTALSLRCVFDLPEPLPEFEFVDAEGRSIDADHETCLELKARLTEAWTNFVGRPNDASVDGWPVRVLTHFANADFEPFIGTVVAWDENSAEETFEFHRVPDPFTVIRNTFDAAGPHRDELFFGLNSDAKVMARPAF